MKKIFVLAATLLASVASFAFQASDTKPMVDAEVHQRGLKGEALNVVVAAGKSGAVKADILACSLVGAGNIPVDVVSVMVRSGFEASVVVNGASCNGANRDVLVAIANREAGNSFGGGGLSEGGLGGNGITINGANFGASRSSTVGGGGRSGLSPS